MVVFDSILGYLCLPRELARISTDSIDEDLRRVSKGHFHLGGIEKFQKGAVDILGFLWLNFESDAFVFLEDSPLLRQPP